MVKNKVLVRYDNEYYFPGAQRSARPTAPEPPAARPAAPASTSESDGPILQVTGPDGEKYQVRVAALSPLDPGGIDIGKSLPDPFTLADLVPLVEAKRATFWIARWKEMGWLNTPKPLHYSRTRTFGEKRI